MKSLVVAVSVTLAGLLMSSNSSAVTFVEDFSGSLPSPSWTTRVDPGYSVQFAGGRAALAKIGATTSNSGSFLRTNFLFDGDFQVDVDLDARTGLSLYEGMTVEWANTTAFAQLYLIDGRVFQLAGPSPSTYTVRSDATSTSELKFRIARTGNTMSLSFDRGLGGFETYYSVSGPTYAGPVFARLEVNQTGSAALSTSYFDNFSVQAGTISPVPEPTQAVLLLAGIALLFSNSKRRGNLIKLPLRQGPLSDA